MRMFDRSMLGLPMLLFAASCVPQALATQAPDKLTAAALAKATPGFSSVGIPTAAVEPPSLPELAQDIAVGAPARPFDLRQASDHDAQTALECLTNAIYYEARSESEGGQRAVAQVVLNRARHPAFPKSVCGVVYQGSTRSTGCQFTFTCDGSLARRPQPDAWERARRIAADALSGYVYEPVGLATHYHTTAIHPWWADALTKAVTIGNHIFYRWRGEWGDPKSFRRPYVGAEAYAAWRSEAGESAAAPEAARPQVVFGVAIHRTGEDANPTLSALEAEAGVRVHRAGSRPKLQTASAAPAGQAPEAAAGIRIHRAGAVEEAQPRVGGDTPAPAVAAALTH
jgi:spore germination cell wall hydrolase CwlJ-like protein